MYEITEKIWDKHTALFIEVYATQEEAVAFIDEEVDRNLLPREFLDELRLRVIIAYEGGDRKVVNDEYKLYFKNRERPKTKEIL